MFVVDASVWMSALVPTDTNFTVSLDWLNQQSVGNILLAEPRILIPEVAGAITRVVSAARGTIAVNVLRNIPVIRFYDVDDNLDRLASDIAVKLSIKGPDAIYIALAQFLSVPLITWDEEMRKKASTIIIAQKPS